jgi:hypothetical protein
MNERLKFSIFVFRRNKVALLSAIVLLLYQFVILKIIYPHAVPFADSTAYVRTAMNDLELTAWPIGYAKFLHGMHFFYRGDWLLVIVQFLLLEAAILYFYFSVLYLLRPVKWASAVIFFFLLVNPFLLCICNYVLSDSLFTTITICWFTLTLWFLYQPKKIHIYLMILLVFLSFSVRYYAVFYPLVTIPLILFSKFSWRTKLAGIGLGCLLFFSFIGYTSHLFKKQDGVRVFSPFSGWQLANNALMMYRHVPQRESDTAPAELQSFHQYIVRELDSLQFLNAFTDRQMVAFFPWSAKSPLVTYARISSVQYPTVEDIRKWVTVSRLYHDYGVFLIKKHPGPFFRYYVVQGIDWFIHPKVEFNNVFPSGGQLVPVSVMNWFGYESTWLNYSPSGIWSITYFSQFIAILNLLFVISLLVYFLRGYNNIKKDIACKAIQFAGTFWILNFLFIIFTAPAVLRYHLSIMVLDIAFIPVIIERIFMISRLSKKLEKSNLEIITHSC